MSLLSLFGCGPKTPAPSPAPGPDDPDRLVSIEYGGTHGYHAYSNIDYRAQRTEDGKTRVTVMVGNDRDRVFEADGSVMDSLEAIVREYRMDRFKEHYQPKMEILDGDSWHLYLDFADGRHTGSGGYMAGPGKDGGKALGMVEGILSRWLYAEPAEEVALTSFRYELHTPDEGSEVFYFKKHDSFNAVYVRPLGSLEGWNYNCGNPDLSTLLARDIRYAHLCSYTGEDLSKEDTSRPRWIAVVEYENGRKFEIMDYFDREKGDSWNDHSYPTMTEREVRYFAEERFNAELERIRQLPPEQLGEHSRTTYDAKGKPQRTINYGGDGTVLNGYDYNDPMREF